MNEYEKIFTEELWKALKCQIKGKIYCAIHNDTLKIGVKNEGIDYKKSYENMARKIMTGEVSTASLSEAFRKEYESFVIRMIKINYFYPPCKEAN